MEQILLERIITQSIKVGSIMTLSELGLLPEMMTKTAAETKYSKRLIKEWRTKGWITGYPTGNSKRGGVYFKRSELETAKLLMDANNCLPDNRIRQQIMK